MQPTRDAANMTVNPPEAVTVIDRSLSFNPLKRKEPVSEVGRATEKSLLERQQDTLPIGIGLVL
jgi:hypothetical protein